MNRKERKFLKDITPILFRLESQWKEPDAKAPSGHYWACIHCDLNCSRHDKHDDDCLSNNAKRTLEAFKAIASNSELKFDYKNNPRSEKDYQSLMKFHQLSAVIKIMYAFPQRLIPLDYSDPANEGVVCECFMNQGERTHDRDCVRQALAKAFSALFKV